MRVARGVRIGKLRPPPELAPVICKKLVFLRKFFRFNFLTFLTL
jgi:hypothetical protein